MTDLSAVFDLALLYNPNLAFKDTGTIRMWVNEGADVDKDILPAMRSCIEKHSRRAGTERIGSFSYFTNEVRKLQAGRELLERHTPKTEDDPEAIHRKAKLAARTVRVLGLQNGEASRFLATYEAQYGPVAV